MVTEVLHPKKKDVNMSDLLFVQNLRLEFVDILGDTASIDEIMVFVAIACLESDYGRSRLAIEQDNFFGMKSPKKRPTTNLDCSKVFATYSSRRSCLLDFVVWLVMNKSLRRCDNPCEVIDFIVDDCGYCPDKGYKEKLIAVYQRVKNW